MKTTQKPVKTTQKPTQNNALTIDYIPHHIVEDYTPETDHPEYSARLVLCPLCGCAVQNTPALRAVHVEWHTVIYQLTATGPVPLTKRRQT